MTTSPTGNQWVPEIPSSWRLLPFRRVARVAAGLVDPEVDPYRNMPLIAPNHVERDTGRLLGAESADEQGAESGKYLVERGQVVYSKIRPALNKVVIATSNCLCSADMYALEGLPGQMDNRFLRYYLLSQPFVAFTHDQSMRVAMPKMNREALAVAPIVVPPGGEQRAIADFLDRETAQIDAMVDAQERLVALLEERRRAAINDHLAPTKVPDGWTEAQLRRVCSTIVDCHHSTPEVDEDAVFEAVRTASVRNGQYRPEFSLRVSEESFHKRNAGVVPREGDVLFTREAPAGEACLVPSDRRVCLGQRMVLLRVDAGIMDPRLVLWSIYTDPVKHFFALQTNGSTVGNLKMSTIGKIPLIVPSLADQASIADRLELHLAQSDTMIAKAQESIALMKERRAALISAAVTGRIDVRTGIEQVERDLEEAMA